MLKCKLNIATHVSTKPIIISGAIKQLEFSFFTSNKYKLALVSETKLLLF
jgi:hypothetical protein